MVDIPKGYESLLERPLYGHLATMRPDGGLQVNPMGFDWDGQVLRFTHTTKRQKYSIGRRCPSACRRGCSVVSDDNAKYRRESEYRMWARRSGWSERPGYVRCGQ
jgi:hypothetical protein